MEEGVVNETLSGPLRDIFDCKQLITDVSGCGNNWYITDPLSSRNIFTHGNVEQIPASQWAN
jgi:hypothetical protein